ncbi:RNA methyltransferase [Castellaniella sp.]|uniref:TrmH family RNA methyltransferase n=1 Tax=Castellaniella sp. TaxID=1955812 RepID=UPI002AFFB07E|nr:RNA methyltransferase [Castellaniella sp.]
MTFTTPVRHIASRDNPDYRLWLRLAQGRPGHRETRILLEGEHLCQTWLEHHGAPVALIVSEAIQAQSPGWIKPLWRDCEHTRRIVLEDHLARILSQVGNGPAVFFLVEPPTVMLPELITEGCLWLDRVQDPGNLGTLLRTAAAAGLKSAYLSPGCAAAWSPKVLRSGQGAHFSLNIYAQVDLSGLHRRLRVPLAATTLQQAQSLYQQDLRQPCAWLFGNEGRGVSADLLALADWRVHIPQSASVESLNVAAAAAICLFEQRRQFAGV